MLKVNNARKLLVALFAVIIMAFTLFSVSACASHEHNFIDGKCECGAIDESYIPPHEHSFINGECACGEIDEEYCSSIYLDILEIMQTMQNRLGDIDSLEELLSQIPNNYRDVAEIKEQLIFVNSQFEVFSNAIYCDVMKSLVSDEEKPQYYINYPSVSRAFFSLIENDEVYNKWNLTNAANAWLEGAEDRILLLSILYGDWSDDQGNILRSTEDEYNNLIFGCNLPNERDSQKTYFYSIKNRDISFSATDGSDTFLAYRITDITEDYIKVLCFADSLTYTLYKA